MSQQHQVLFFAAFALAVVMVKPQNLGEMNSCWERGTSGPICESCNLLAICVRINNTEWMTLPVEECDEAQGYFCDSHLGMCSNTTGRCLVSGADIFACTSQGVFPDPYDCRKYHMCYMADGASLSSPTLVCGSGKAFNVATSQCTSSVTDPICMERQYNCTQAGDMKAWPGNNNYFYVCKAAISGTGTSSSARIIYPEMYRCPDGEYFNGVYCSADPSNNSPWVTGGTTNAAANGPCTQTGLVPHPTDCKSYYYCSAIGATLALRHCPTGTRYDQQRRTCVQGSC